MLQEGLKIMGTVAMDNLQNFLEMRFGEVEHIERGIPKVRKVGVWTAELCSMRNVSTRKKKINCNSDQILHQIHQT